MFKASKIMLINFHGATEGLEFICFRTLFKVFHSRKNIFKAFPSGQIPV